MRRDPEHQARLAQLIAAFTNGTYELPSEVDWLQRFRDRPEVVGLLVRDLIIRSVWEARAEKRHGRRPHLKLTHADLLQHLPAPVLAAMRADGLLPPDDEDDG